MGYGKYQAIDLTRAVEPASQFNDLRKEEEEEESWAEDVAAALHLLPDFGD